jgi:hypothetical protein
MGGEGSGNWYRFNKKTTIDECQRIDVRYLHREGLLKPGRWFSLRWSRAGRETGSIRGVVSRDDRPEQIILLYRHRSGASGEWEDVQEPVPLSWTACNFGGERPWFVCPGAGCGRRVAILYGPGRYFLCRHCYDLRYENQREDKMHRALRRAQKIREGLGGSANMMEPFPQEAHRDAPKYLHEDVLGAPRGGDGAACRHEGVARQVREEGRIALLKGFVRQFLGIADGNRMAIVVKPALASPC